MSIGLLYVKEKVAVVTVQGRTYFLIVNLLREQNIPFVSLIPGEPVPPKIKLVITTPQEQPLVEHEKLLIFRGEEDLDSLPNEIKRMLLGKEAYELIVVGIDPGEAIGLAILADGKVISEGDYCSSHELINSILKVIRNINYAVTRVIVKIGNGVPVYRELLEELDSTLPPSVELVVVGEAGTNKPLDENHHSRDIRHISSAIRIAARLGYMVPRRRTIAANNAVQ